MLPAGNNQNRTTVSEAPAAAARGDVACASATQEFVERLQEEEGQPPEPLPQQTEGVPPPQVDSVPLRLEASESPDAARWPGPAGAVHSEDPSSSARGRFNRLPRTHHTLAGDDEQEGDVCTVKCGPGDEGALGIEFKGVCIDSVDPAGLGQYRCNRRLEPGMLLVEVNGVPAARLHYDA
eukprot:COSAG05_NODE_4469_length_1501_cov_115.953125_2_plen_180_part_00